MSGRDFDQGFYARFYGDPATRVASRQSVERLCAFVASYLRYLELEVSGILDLGCGVGLWQAPLRAVFPRARYRGVEVSEHLCEELGWELGSVVDYPGAPADLVICQGVLQYLNDRHAARAIRTLAAKSRKALYLEALTLEDWRHNCDQDRTDGDVHLRPASWYRARLRRHFVSCGGGLFVPRAGDAVLFELEKAGG